VRAQGSAAVAALQVRRKALVRNHDERTRALLSMAANLPDRPSPDEIHDLRVAARRIQVTRRLMPMSVRRSQGSKRFDFALRTVLKATSQLRDMDTLMDALKSYTGSLPGGLLVNLENQRSDAAARAKLAIGGLAEVPAPEPDASELRGKRLSKRLRKAFRKHAKEASSLLTDVLSDESKAVELHSLRKEVKKMRYLTELADKPPQLVASLARWQESLGAIHDIDVAIAYLKEVDTDSGRAILELQRARHSKYLAFVRDYGTAQLQAPGEKGGLFLGALSTTGLSPARA
jgi:CHAD domain-containing protein